MSAGAGPRFEVRVVDEVLAEDLARCTPAARAAIESMVATLRDEGIPRDWLRRCEEEGQDGTRLKGCVKLYIPQPAGQLGGGPFRRQGGRETGPCAGRGGRAPPGATVEAERLRDRASPDQQLTVAYLDRPEQLIQEQVGCIAN